MGIPGKTFSPSYNNGIVFFQGQVIKKWIFEPGPNSNVIEMSWIHVPVHLKNLSKLEVLCLR